MGTPMTIDNIQLSSLTVDNNYNANNLLSPSGTNVRKRSPRQKLSPKQAPYQPYNFSSNNNNNNNNNNNYHHQYNNNNYNNPATTTTLSISGRSMKRTSLPRSNIDEGVVGKAWEI